MKEKKTHKFPPTSKRRKKSGWLCVCFGLAGLVVPWEGCGGKWSRYQGAEENRCARLPDWAWAGSGAGEEGLAGWRCLGLRDLEAAPRICRAYHCGALAIHEMTKQMPGRVDDAVATGKPVRTILSLHSAESLSATLSETSSGCIM